MSDIPSTQHDEQEQTQPDLPLVLQSYPGPQTNKLPAPPENQPAPGPTSMFADQQESGFQFVMFAPDQQPVDPQVGAPPTPQSGIIPLPVTAPPPPPLAPAKSHYRTSPLVKSILIAQSLALIIGALMMLYINVYEPARISAEATATTGTAFAHSTSTSVGATSTAQIEATITAQANATSTAESIVKSTATAIAQQNYYNEATKGTPFINSSLAYPEGSLGWEINYSDSSGCYFIGGAYHIHSRKGFYESCFATTTNLRNFAFQVEMTLVKGDIGGVFFRSTNRSGYIFHLQSNGSYVLYRGDYNPRLSEITYTNLLHASHWAVKQFAEPNLLTVIARGNRIYLYVNKQYVADIIDATYESGQIGVYTSTDYETTDIAFRNLKVWKL